MTRRPWFERRDLVLEPGEVVLLSGPTGSGKSLFLRALADLDPLDEPATVELSGRPRESFAPTDWRRRVLLVQQSAPVVAGSVRDNLERIATVQASGARGADSEIDELGLDPAAAADRLSGGEAQLLALARAFLVAPEVYLLDESTSALDAATTDRIEDELRRRLTSGAAILWVSHDERVAERMGARVERFP